MELRRFKKEDLKTINGWYAAHGMRGLSEDELPSTGLIIPDVAANFLYLTDSSIGFIENFIANPHASMFDIALALEETTKHFLMMAAQLKRTKIFALTRRNSITKRVERVGFKNHGPWNMLSMEVH